MQLNSSVRRLAVGDSVRRSEVKLGVARYVPMARVSLRFAPQMQIRPIPEAAGWQAAFTLLVDLRPHLDFATFVERCRAAQMADAYTLYGAYQDGELVGVMGLRTLVDLLHGRHLYIDDLVVAPAVRSQGVGRQLLEFAERLAAEAGGVGLRLCTGIDHEPAKRFYVREGWSARAVAFKKMFPT